MSKYAIHKERILQLTKQDYSPYKIIKTLGNEIGINPDSGYFKRYVRSVINDTKNETIPNDYEKETILSALDNTRKIMNIDDYCDYHNLPREDISSYKLVTHTGTPFYNIVFRENKTEGVLDLDFINEIVKKHIQPVKLKSDHHEKLKSDHFDRLIYTDAHIGMTPNKDGNALYGGKWDKEEIMNRLDIMCNYIIQEATSNILIIDDLGDFVDGWDGQTVRKGHELPQNMTNKEMFDNGLSFKIAMIDRLVTSFDNIIVNNICEDNHAGDFGYVINSAFKSIIEAKYDKVEVTNHLKFINHYNVNDLFFVISHGKDSKNLKFGFKPCLDSKQVEKIDQYLKHNKVYKEANHIEFSKGDSHQFLLDYATSDDFDYFNYPAFSPSSEWVQTNFKKGRSGFVLQKVFYDGRKEVKPFFFK